MFTSNVSMGQSDLEIHNLDNKSFKYSKYIRTDTLSLWSFSIKYYLKKTNSDSVKYPIANIKFYRNKSVLSYDSDRNDVSFMIEPKINFDIFYLEDLKYCQDKMVHAMKLSSCAGPNSGGDIIKIKNYVFYNASLCMSCYSFVQDVDYCRSAVYAALDGINHKTKSNLNVIINHIRKKIKESPN